jgi:hypothetical protein
MLHFPMDAIEHASPPPFFCEKKLHYVLAAKRRCCAGSHRTPSGSTAATPAAVLLRLMPHSTGPSSPESNRYAVSMPKLPHVCNWGA